MSISHLIANDPEIPVSNIIQEVHVLFQMGCTYKRAWNPLRVGIVHRFYLRHIQANFNKTFKNTNLKSLMWQAGTETKQWKFDRIIKEIQERNRKWVKNKYLCAGDIFATNVQKNLPSEFSSGLE
ncbi:hypothetical protein M9H77_16367 [Catharanthus roseus]|uniref:Uncharacterized protein n=1 Tax=Catharanthus roseus TaxID=4058 RepID=A0ACC0B1K4_CATRO|nr:hypothetical protein M9H77_16367 [Catharanthus roseus]